MVRILAAIENELLVADEKNRRWEAGRRLDGAHVACVATDPLNPARVYAGTFDRGLWRSADAGASWEPAGEVVSGSVTAVAVSRSERAGGHGVVYAGTEPSALYRSEDAGETWRELGRMRELPSAPEWSFPPRPETSHVRAVVSDPNAEGTVYVAVEAGALVRSFDGGETWEDRVPDGPRDTHTLATHLEAPGRLYSAAGDGFTRAGTGYAESPDGGDTWEHPSDGLDLHYLWGLAVDPTDPGRVVVSAAHGPLEAHSPVAARSKIYHRAGTDGSWQEAIDGLPAPDGRVAAILAANEAEPGCFYALTNDGLYRSPDGGVCWGRLGLAWPDRYLRQRPGALVVFDVG